LLRHHWILQHSATHCTIATYCNTLQLTATHFNLLQHMIATVVEEINMLCRHCALQHTATLLQITATHCNTLQHTATHCNTLQHTATHSNTLQHSCKSLQLTYDSLRLAATNVYQCGGGDLCAASSLHVATHCSTLQLTATHCNTLQRTATHCNTLQHTATHCKTLQLT